MSEQIARQADVDDAATPPWWAFRARRRLIDQLRLRIASLLAERVAARHRVHDWFKRRNTDGSCACPYCTNNVEEVYEHAANLELDLFSAHDRVTALSHALACRDAGQTSVDAAAANASATLASVEL